jgi:methyl-accepting chemotaxis protein
MRNLKMRTVVISIVAITVAVGILLLCILASINSNSMLRDKINDNMSTYLDAQEKTIEAFVEDSERTIRLYSEAGCISALIQNDKDNAAANPERTLPEFTDETYNTAAFFKDNYPAYEEAQQYTLDFFGQLNNWEGLYTGNLETRILSYSVPPVIGKVLRTDADKRAALIDELKANPDKVYNAGIIVSPGTGQLCLSMYYPVMRDGEFIGYVGGGVFNTELENMLSKNAVSGISSSDFYMFNSKTGVLFSATDASEADFIAKETENVLLKDVMTKIQGGAENGQFEYKNKDYKNGETFVVNYESVPGRDWAVVLTAEKSGLYEASNKNLRNMVIIGIVAFILILVLVAVSITMLTNPLAMITSAVKDLGQLNLEKNEEVIRRSNDKNEVGVISHEIEILRESLSNIVDTLKDCSDSLDASAGNMENNSKNLVGFVSDNTATTEELASSLTSTGSIVDKVNNNIKVMNDIVEKVSTSLKEGTEHSETILATAETMEKKSAQALVDSERNIEENKKAVADVTVKLRTLSKINTFVNDILSIATQTKLLSLNASIEAARAGEQGKGFAVVATEIGTLASNTSSAAQKIQDITRLTNESVDETVKCFDELNKYLENDIMTKFEEFNKETQNNNHITAELIDNIKEVSNNVTEFKKYVNQLVSQMDDIRMLSEQNSAGIDDIVDKNEQTSRIADDMAGSVDNNKGNAKALGDIISRFTLNR